ncbi:NAD(P)/FAD-dependent oxidoreductase [Rhodopirellula halodulae]|uniref:NAD(P)/FAD-dependent oxidoreductase n=1 Tax=Rhodopirellula halodulae TaxID=2894198 RepID=UPI001E58370A|nr:NAD(P)/FAD-dependent oxidoreductase [Rhodopirellula sp. JC737]MCC9658116.1 NAD(P)/FAD-dependent oxidoreductase [Rhodopirellula sp. JC737]
MTIDSKQRPHVVVIGGGFAGLQAVRDLRKADVSVTLLDRRNFHLFQPLLYQVATGELSPANIATPLRGILRKQANARVLLEEVTSISLADQLVRTTDSSIRFDYLVVATGAIHHYFGREEWRSLAPGLKTIENATEIRRQILAAFEAAERCNDPDEVHEMLTFVIVGGGPTGCELAGALAEISRHTLQNDFRSIQPADAKIVLVESGDAPLDVYPEPLPSRAADDLRRLGVEVRSQCRVVEIEPTHVMVRNKVTEEVTRLNTRTVLWAAGVKASPLGGILCEAAKVEPDRGGRVPVKEDLSLPQHANVFVCGDLAKVEMKDGKEVPGLAPAAMQMGAHAAACIHADLRSKERRPFRYRDKGSLAVIGRFSAVGQIGRYKAKGFVAWFIWLFIHLMYITMFRNRLLVLMQWGWTFFTHDRSARLITDGANVEISTMEQATGWNEDPAMPTNRNGAARTPVASDSDLNV